MGCVNISNREFKNLVKECHVSSNSLQEIIHQYWDETGSEDLFPSKTYIKAQLGEGTYVETLDSAKKVWDKWYSKPQKFSSKEKFQEAKDEAYRLFPASAVAVYTDDNGKKVLAVKRPVKQIEYLESDAFETRQDFEDYYIDLGEMPPQEAIDLNSPSKRPTFTFKDGYTIDTPFRLNSQQENALNVMSDFINSNESVMTLSGYAGTGKTSIMEMLAKKARHDFRHIVFSASTNKAAAVLKERVKKSGFDASTLHKAFGIRVAEDAGEEYDASNKVQVQAEPKVEYNDIVVIDEASMIDKESYDKIRDIAEKRHLKIIYVGDKAQLPAVKDGKPSEVFTDPNIKVVTLTKVERTGDNAILKEATDIREGKPLSGVSSFNSRGEGVAYVKKSNEKAVEELIKEFTPHLRENPEYFRILAFRNDAVEKYNEMVRRTLGYNDFTPRIGEPIMGYANWGYVWVSKKESYYRFVNSESYTVVQVNDKRVKSWTLEDGTVVDIQITPMTLEDPTGKRTSLDFVDIRNNLVNRDHVKLLALEKASIWKRLNAVGKRTKDNAHIWRPLQDRVNAIEEFLFINDDVINEDVWVEDKQNPGQMKHPIIQEKIFDFGYAMTTHKSQGSTFTNVIVDEADIATAKEDGKKNEKGMSMEELAQMQDVKLDNVQVASPSNLTKGTPAAKAEKDNLSMHQHLDYVAVTRATDTVTIIADDATVKREDTPLNHMGKQNIQTEEEAPAVSPKEAFNEIKIVEDSNIITNEGTRGAAAYDRDSKTIKVDRKLLKQKFEEKAWTNPRKLIETLHGEPVESYAQALPEGQFESYQEWEQFVINHEYQHSLYSREDFDRENPNKTKGDYETEINRRALAQLFEQASDLEGLLSATTETSAPKASTPTPEPIQVMDDKEVWDHVKTFAEPMGGRPITFNGTTYTIREGRIYDKNGKEALASNTNKNHDRNRVFFDLAIQEDRAVMVTHNGNKYVVDNNQNIMSVQTGKIMEWLDNNGDRKAVLKEAASKFKDLIEARQQRSKEIMPQTLAHMQLLGIPVHDRADIIEYLKKNGSAQMQEAIEQREEMKAIREQAIKDGQIVLKEDGTFDYALAPNGEKSNLNEKQWLQVRTKAFKKWFGDWLKANQFNLDNIDYSKVDIEEVEKPWKNDPSKSNKTIRIYLKGQHDKGYFELVKDHEFGQFSVHFKTTKPGAEYNSPTTTESTKDDRKILFTELVKAIPEGAIVSTWGSISEDGIRGLDNVGRGMTKIGERDVTLKSDGSQVKIPIYQKGEGVSKVVDENGEPKIMYRGDYSGKTVFNPHSVSNNITGVYLTPSKQFAQNYAKKEGTAIYEVFVNAKNIINQEELNRRHTLGELKEHWNMNSVRSKFHKNGEFNEYDAFDDGGDFVVDNSNQIKSATDNNGMFSTENDDIQMAIDINNTPTPIKEKYQGKLIYAQSGTGKSTIADNVNVFDSDYLLGQVLGVSTETAGFFFKTLSAEQKKAFGEQYRNLIREKLSEGKTVLTANNSMLDEADVVVYNKSAEQAEERINRTDRAISNRYSALDYHKQTLDSINKLKENAKDKEYIELDGEDYLSHHLLASDDANRSLDKLERQSAPEGLRKQQDEIISSFLKEFGITVNHLDNYEGELPLFDALNRVINAKTPQDITDGVGYAIAFMMQGDPEMQSLIMKSHGLAGDFNRIFNIPGKGKRTAKNLRGALIFRQDVVREVGKEIAKELRNQYSENPAPTTTKNSSILSIIRNFFRKLITKIGGYSDAVKEEKELFVRDIIEALGREDFTRIKGPLVKEGTLEKAEQVDVETAFKENPFEEEIISKLSDNGIALAGSASIALEGTLYRPSENPLHDIDFNAGDNSSKAKLDTLLPKIFGKDRISYSHKVGLENSGTITYVTFDRPFKTVWEENKEGRKVPKYYDMEGNYLGERVRGKTIELKLAEGVKGKILDFFVGKNKGSEYGTYKKEINGKEYLISHSKAAFAAKILWARPKDMWDYKNFRRNNAAQDSNKTEGIAQTYTTKNGELYGFADWNGEVYIDETVATSNHSLHEFSHLWDRVVSVRNPRLWKQGVTLFKSPKLKLPGHEKSLWQEIEESDNYGKKWKAQGYTGYQLESFIASEVHSRILGLQGEALLTSIAKQKGTKSIIGKLRDWILEFWKELKATFTNWTDEELAQLTVDKINQMTVRDFTEGNIFRQGGERGIGQYQAMTPEMKKTAQKVKDYIDWQSEHLTFNKETHEYFYNGEKIDYSVTQYGEEVYGKKNISGYEHSSAMGNSADALYRDFFMGKDVTKISYPNLNSARKQAIMQDCQRLKEYFDKYFNGKYQVFTREYILAGRMETPEGDKTIAGTMDMVVVDGNGDIYIFDMKVKKDQTIDSWNNRRDYTFQQNGYRQLNEAIFPELKGRVKGMFLLWMDTTYPTTREASYKTDRDTNLVVVTDNEVQNIPLADYTKWKTPALKKNVKDSVIPLTEESHLKNVRPIDANWDNNQKKEGPTPETNNPGAIDVSTISDKTADYGVQLTDGSKDFWRVVYKWKDKNPEGIAAYRKFGAKPESFTPETVEQNWIGNPFSTEGRGKETVQQFYDWIITGNNFGNEFATEEFRQAIIKKLKATPEDSPILYYTELDRPSHATVIGYLINNKELLDNAAKPQKTNAEIVADTYESTISTVGYRKGDPQAHKDTAYIFTENAQANAAALGLDDSWIEEGYNKGDKVKLNVSDMNGENQAGIRAVKVDGKDQITPNAFGIVVKKYQQKESSTRFLQAEGQFKDTDADFELFKTANLDMFKRLEESGLKKIMWPSQMGLGKAALPQRFAEWLQGELNRRFGVVSEVQKNNRAGYEGYGLQLISIQKAEDISKQPLSPAQQKQPVTITESTGGYPQRTRENITWSDVTLSFANDDTTAGERLTEREANNQGKYIYEFLPDALDMNDIKRLVRNQIIGMKNDQSYGHKGKVLPTKDIKLNIAGNGIYTLLPKGITQEQLNDFVTEYLREMIANGVTISEIRSGGQTGVDEAGIIAAQRLGISASVHAPKGFVFRTAEGKDVADRNTFESRFNQTSNPVQQQVIGENISSKGSDFAKRLTNPFNNETVEFRGTKFDNAEHAYQTWKSGKFDQRGFDAHGGKVRGTTDYTSNYQTMVEILIAKLQQHPDLVEGITERGGEAYLRASTHDVVGDPYWETKTGQNKFIEALTEAYNAVMQPEEEQPTPVPDLGPQYSEEVEVPNYALFRDVDKLEVDAAWKVDILEDLDARIKTLRDENEEDNDIDKLAKNIYYVLNDIDKLMKASSKEEYERASTTEMRTFERRMSEYWKRNMQINNLIDNEVGLKSTEIRETAESVVDSISDIITEIINDPSIIDTEFPTLSIEKDLKGATREDVIDTIGINNLIAKAKERFENLMNDESNPEVYNLYETTDHLIDQAFLISDNWDAIMELASDYFAINEGFGLRKNTRSGAFDSVKKKLTEYDYDNYTDPQDLDAVREEADEQEHWQIENRTIDIFNSMTALIRQALHECYLLDNEGKKILNKWGIPKRVNKITAVNNILYWTKGALSLPEMIERLEKKAEKRPWVQQLVDRLKDETGKESDFQSQFFGVMNRHYQVYDNVKERKGKYGVTVINGTSSASKEVIGSITAKFNMGEHPMFTEKGKIDTSMLEALNGWYRELSDIVKTHDIRTDNSGNYTSKTPLSSESYETAVKAITAASIALGYNVTEDMIETIISPEAVLDIEESLRFITKNLNAQVKNNSEEYEPFNTESTNNIRGELQKFFKHIVEHLEEDATNAFFEEGKMYQGNVTPSFLSLLFDHFHQEDSKFYDWLTDNYGKSEWFVNEDGEFKLPMLETLARSPEARAMFQHRVQLNFNKHEYMRKMSPEEYVISAITEYFSEFLGKDTSATPAWFRIPLQSNKPSSEFYKFYTDRSSSYKDNIVNKLYKMFLQEVSRIDTVRKRGKGKDSSDALDSYDTTGRKFNFLPFLNGYVIDGGQRLGTDINLIKEDKKGKTAAERNQILENLLNKKLNAKEALEKEEETDLEILVKEATKNYLQETMDSALDNWEKAGILKAAAKVKNIKSLGYSVRQNLENFLWNDYYMANSILQLTIIDKAFYPNAIEMQKRLAELHAPGTRGNKEARDYKGQKVSDGYYRTAILNDYDGFMASIISNLEIVFQKRIDMAPESEKEGWEALKDRLLRKPGTRGKNDKGGVYWNINVTDGQGYSSPTSYRKKAFMFGKWSHKAEEIYERLLQGDYNLPDLETAFQPLKPFVYGHVTKEIGVNFMNDDGTVTSSPIQTIPTPFQAKNSEYLLIIADALTRNEDTGRPNILRAIFDIMEESAFDKEGKYNGQGIDTIQFKSAIKSGGQGTIDLSPFATGENGETDAYAHLKHQIFQDEKNDDGTYYRYSDNVTKLDSDYYALQQEVPKHFKDHRQLESSQQRMNIPADLEFLDINGAVNLYKWKEGKEERALNAKEIRREYEEVHADNIKKGIDEVVKKFHLDSLDKKERNLALSEILQDEIMSSPRYGIDLFQACQIDAITGEFRIPKGDPVQSKRIEQLINSLIKAEVNKQKVSGGPIVQVTNFGASTQLHIRFHDKQGGILMTEEEFNRAQEQKKEEGAYKDADGKDIVMYRGYALTEDREAVNLEETIGHTAVDYDESLKDAIYFTSSREEAEDYAKTRTDKSDETFERNGEIITQRNRHYTGDYAKVSAYKIKESAKVERYKDMKDYVKHGKGTDADVIILEKGTMWSDNSEYIILNKDVVIPTKKQSYQQYCKDNQAGIAYYEIFAPIGMQKIFEKFKNLDGTINIEAIEKCDPDLLKVITARIPNEDKYSIAHAKIVGFLPPIAGEAIMFPYELTEIDDSDFDVDKRYVMQKVLDIVEDTSAIRRSLYRKLSKEYSDTHNGKKMSDEKWAELGEIINKLWDKDEVESTKNTSFGNIYEMYQNILHTEFPYRTVHPKKGTEDSNNNKIIDMCWAILSNEMTAPQMLNPGGFETPKHTAYVIAAYKRKRGKDDWNMLNAMDTKELKKLAEEEMDLARFDHHVQFYKQNAAGSNLIGVFAVNKIAHAILGGNHILVDIEALCGDPKFTIGSTVFEGMMELDQEGKLIGKNLGSGVGASADTAKDPWLDIININMASAGVFCTMLRMGMPLEEAELFMAQDVISDVLMELSRKSLDKKYTPLSSIVSSKLADLATKHGYTRETADTEESKIYSEPISREELLEGLVHLEDDDPMKEQRDALDFKVLLAFQRLLNLADAIKKPTFITRLNSMKTAAGPLIIDNIVLAHNLNEFRLSGNAETTGFFLEDPNGKIVKNGKKYSPVTTDTILNMHPILKQFSKAIDTQDPECLTERMFYDMPAGSRLFKMLLEGDEEGNVTEGLPSNIKDIIYASSNRKLLTSLSDFFQSYLMVASGAINPDSIHHYKEVKRKGKVQTVPVTEMAYYIEDFPKEFLGGKTFKGLKDKYKDNPFVQAIIPAVESESGNVYLTIKTTGMKEQEKEPLRMGWIDLHKVDPELSIMLFKHAFYKGGLGFSPKTYMGLIPTYVKERIPGYLDTYRHFPEVVPDLIIDQWIRNNWDNDKLVPTKGGKGTSYDIKGNNLYVRAPKDKADLAGVRYMKTKEGDEVTLWRLLDSERENRETRHYVKVDPLGNNGEFLEMSNDKRQQALVKTVKLKERDTVEQLPEPSNAELDNDGAGKAESTVSEAEQNREAMDMVELIMLNNGYDEERARKHFERYRNISQEEDRRLAQGQESQVDKNQKLYIANLFKRAGLELSMEEAWKKFKKLC